MEFKQISGKVVKWLGFLVVLCGGALLFGCSGGGSDSDGGSDSGSDPGQAEAYVVTSPVRISEFDAQTLLVSDANTQKVLLVDKQTLEPTDGFKVAGKPSGVVFADNQFFVGNSTNGSVDVFNRAGRLVRRLGERGQFGLVNDLAINRALGLIYVLDAKTRLVSLFQLDGTAVGTIGPEPMTRPTALTIDGTGRLIVSDFGNPANGSFSARPVSLQVFNAAGGFSHSINVGTNENTTPQGLFADTTYVYMANARSGEVKVFNIDTAAQVLTLGTLGVGAGELFYPLDVYVDALTSEVFVTDHKNQRITVYPGGGLP